MIPAILIVLALLIIIFVVAVTRRPGEFRVTRSVAISAPPEEAFGNVNDFHCWEAWSPWAKLDPTARNDYQGPSAGAGAIFAWVGNRKVGEGRMTITDSQPCSLIRIRLDFLKPFKNTGVAEFTFKPQGGQTLVSWSMTSKQNFVCKAASMVMNMDKMLGGQFDSGLAQLKAVSETAAVK